VASTISPGFASHSSLKSQPSGLCRVKANRAVVWPGSSPSWPAHPVVMLTARNRSCPQVAAHRWPRCGPAAAPSCSGQGRLRRSANPSRSRWRYVGVTREVEDEPFAGWPRRGRKEQGVTNGPEVTLDRKGAWCAMRPVMTLRRSLLSVALLAALVAGGPTAPAAAAGGATEGVRPC
jgi:hypothetical protein